MNRTAHDDYNDSSENVLEPPAGSGAAHRAAFQLADADKQVKTAVEQVERALHDLRTALESGCLSRQELLSAHQAVRQMQDHLAELIREASSLFEEANGR